MLIQPWRCSDLRDSSNPFDSVMIRDPHSTDLQPQRIMVLPGYYNIHYVRWST